MMTDHLIWTKQNALHSEFCRHVIDKFEKDERKEQGKLGSPAKIDLIRKRSMDLNISRLNDWKREDKVFYDTLQKGLSEYERHISLHQKHFPYLGNVYNLKDSGYQIQRTHAGEFYEWHSDAWIESPYIRTMTYIWYLNTINEDGYTEFSNGMKIQPEEGKLLFFPATWTYVHRGYPPKSQTKYIATGWILFHNPEALP